MSKSMDLEWWNAIVTNCETVIRQLIEKGVNVNTKGLRGETALMRASARGFLSLCELLTQNGADIDVGDQDGWTALHQASFNGHVRVVRLLASLKGNVNARASWGDTPAHKAAWNDHLPVLEELHRSGADFNIRNNDGRTILEEAERMQKEETVAFIRSLLSGEEPNAVFRKDHVVSGTYSPTTRKKCVIVAKQKEKKGLKGLLNRRRVKDARPEKIDAPYMEDVLETDIVIDSKIPGESWGVEEEIQVSIDGQEVLKSQERAGGNREGSANPEETSWDSADEGRDEIQGGSDEKDLLIFLLRRRNEELSMINKSLQDAIESNLQDNHKVVHSLQNELDKKTNEIELLRLSANEREQKIKDLERLLGIAEESGQETDTRVGICEEILEISAGDIRLTASKLGSGSFGEVRIGFWRGCRVAVKIFDQRLAKERQRRLLEEEVGVCSKLHHPNVVSVCGVSLLDDDASLALVMELLQATLSDVIEFARRSGQYLTLREQADVSHDCLSGLTYLHRLPSPVLHGDIKPSNILVTSLMVAKLGDLGVTPITESSLSGNPAKPQYIAPERLSFPTLPNSQQADIYSLGATLYEWFTGKQLVLDDRPVQMRSVEERDLRLVCVEMTCEAPAERIPACGALSVNDRVLKKDEYVRCLPRRMVKGLMDGAKSVALCQKP